MSIHFNHIIRSDITSGDRQETRGLDLPDVGNEQKTIAIIDTARRTVQSIRVLEACSLKGNRRSIALLGFTPLDRHATIHRCGGRFDVEWSNFRKII